MKVLDNQVMSAWLSANVNYNIISVRRDKRLNIVYILALFNLLSLNILILLTGSANCAYNS